MARGTWEVWVNGGGGWGGGGRVLSLSRGGVAPAAGEAVAVFCLRTHSAALSFPLRIAFRLTLQTLTPPPFPPPSSQVGAHLAKDAFSNYVATPLTNQAQDTVLEATGLDGIANQVGGCAARGGLAPGRTDVCLPGQRLRAGPLAIASPASSIKCCPSAATGWLTTLGLSMQRDAADSCPPPPASHPVGVQMGSLTSSGIRKVQQFSGVYNQFFK